MALPRLTGGALARYGASIARVALLSGAAREATRSDRYLRCALLEIAFRNRVCNRVCNRVRNRRWISRRTKDWLDALDGGTRSVAALRITLDTDSTDGQQGDDEDEDDDED
eukprot:Selendium_serpulae@DN341_c1_g1_i1.p3